MKSLLLKTVDSLGLFPVFNIFTRNTATVFMIHRIVPDQNSSPWDTTPKLFRSYFEYLKTHKYNVMSLTQYVNDLINHEDTYKSIVFTVDDGYRDFYLNAYPVFKEFGHPATIFITSDFINNSMFFWWNKIEYVIHKTSKQSIALTQLAPKQFSIRNAGEKSVAISEITDFCKALQNKDKLTLIDDLVEKLEVDISQQPCGEYAPLSWKEIHEMASNGIEFYPHTKTHPILSRVPMEQKREEVSEPKKIIEEQLNTKADIFCYPNGGPDDFDEETISVLKTAGYIAAVTGIPGLDSTMKTADMFRLRRFGLTTEHFMFKQYICGLEGLKRKLLGIVSKRYR